MIEIPEEFSVAIRLKSIATDRDLQVIETWLSQYAVARDFNKFFEKLNYKYIGEVFDRRLFNLIRAEFDEYAREAKQSIPYLKNLPILTGCFPTEEYPRNSIIFYPSEYTRELLTCTYGSAADYPEVRDRLLLVLSEQDKLKEAERQAAEAQTIIPTGIKFYEYPGYPRIQRMEPDQLRASGFMPEGYELISVKDLGYLLYAAQNTYDLAVAGHQQQIVEAADRTVEILKHRQTVLYEKSLNVSCKPSGDVAISLSDTSILLGRILLDGSVATIESLNVLLAARRQGIATFMINRFEKLVRDKLGSAQVLILVTNTNIVGKKFVESLGYVPEGEVCARRITYRKEIVWRME